MPVKNINTTETFQDVSGHAEEATIREFMGLIQNIKLLKEQLQVNEDLLRGADGRGLKPKYEFIVGLLKKANEALFKGIAVGKRFLSFYQKGVPSPGPLSKTPMFDEGLMITALNKLNEVTKNVLLESISAAYTLVNEVGDVVGVDLTISPDGKKFIPVDRRTGAQIKPEKDYPGYKPVYTGSTKVYAKPTGQGPSFSTGELDEAMESNEVQEISRGLTRVIHSFDAFLRVFNEI